jgi:hypothetical protein
VTRWPAAVALFVILFSVACATTPVNMEEPRRIVGTETSVRIDAEIRGDELRSGSPLAITYEITNQRAMAIAVADVLPIATYDKETRTVTVDIGAEVPGEETLPRLVSIAPGEKKTFAANARMNFLVAPRNEMRSPTPAALRIKVNFLGDVEPFRQLLNIPERIVADRNLASTLFPIWLEQNEVLYTNTIPMRWTTRDALAGPTAPPPPTRTRRP